METQFTTANASVDVAVLPPAPPEMTQIIAGRGNKTTFGAAIAKSHNEPTPRTTDTKNDYATAAMKAFTDMMATHLTTANTSAVVAVAPLCSHSNDSEYCCKRKKGNFWSWSLKYPGSVTT